MLTGTFWSAADGSPALAGRMVFMAGLVAFFADLADWYLLLSVLLLSVGFPFRLPLGDLSLWIRGYSERAKAREDIV